ncbi:MAG TPA: 3-deoxy-7-phosphoheptulonate synthase, partial [Aggregatilineales bacterium]|nr:3-deoxy-7-phosphoheptulonate synthase [Aggregatilineales bacterium]
MIIVMSVDASDQHIADVEQRIRDLGFDVHPSRGHERTVLGVVGNEIAARRDQLEAINVMPGVAEVIKVSHPYKLASREFHPEPTLVPLNGIRAGSQQLVLIAGPCSVESREQILETAHAVKEAGATALRGGAFKPRTSPFSFQGLGEEGLKYLVEAREQTGLPIVTEVMEPGLVAMVSEYADVLQIGARNMQNYPLLNAAGESGQTVLLKRGMSSTIQELLMAADYILQHRNPNVILCERGIRTYETATRNTFDLNAIPVLKEQSHLPVIADPSHATGKWEYVESAALAAIAAGADGLIIEVHPDPACAVSDGQ